MNYSPKFLIHILEENGFKYKRSKGSHFLYHHPEKDKTIVVPVHGNRDLPRGTFYAILKQAGIEYE
jgi:predicted RNA binding protein YcfA (HicA-like mRNA interferase family)